MSQPITREFIHQIGSVQNVRPTDATDNLQVSKVLNSRPGAAAVDLDVRGSDKARAVCNHGDVAFVIISQDGTSISDRIRSRSGHMSTLPRVATTVANLSSFAEIKPVGVILAGPGFQPGGSKDLASMVTSGIISVVNSGTGSIAAGDQVHVVMPTLDATTKLPKGQARAGWDGYARAALYSDRELDEISDKSNVDFAALNIETPLFVLFRHLVANPTRAHNTAVVAFLRQHNLFEYGRKRLDAVPTVNSGSAANFNAGTFAVAIELKGYLDQRSFLGTAFQAAAPGRSFQIRIG